MTDRWRIGVDVGGTFADCVAVGPGGERRRIKLLTDGRLRSRCAVSDGAVGLVAVPEWAAPALPGMRASAPDGRSLAVRSARSGDGRAVVELDGAPGAWVDLDCGEEAPVLAARLLLGCPPGTAVPPVELRIGTTRGTNALLESRGDRVALFVNDGLEGLLEIGTQQRLGLFDLVPRKPPRLAGGAYGMRARRLPDGTAPVPFDDDSVRGAARLARRAGFRHAAVALLHSVAFPEDERRVSAILEQEGFVAVALSSDCPSAGTLVARAQTAAADAALDTAVRGLLSRIEAALPGSRVLAATSAGGVVDAHRYRPKDSLLSGPAMGCAAARELLRSTGFTRAITFDMGGTSTDVARIEPDGIALRGQTSVSGVTVSVPAVDVVSVAAGGGSVCRGSPEGLFVGPASAGASPGPACYGRGGPLTVTDVNLLLGRLPAGVASLPLDVAAAREAAAREAAAAGTSVNEALRGFLALANEHMAAAVRAVTVTQGFDPREYALAVFGGAGGQHACAVADALGIERVVFLPHAGFVSGEGALRAAEQRVRSVDVDAPLGDGNVLRRAIDRLVSEAAFAGGEVRRITVELRSPGQAGSIDVECEPGAPIDAGVVRKRFIERFGRTFGRAPRGHDPHLQSVRVVAERATAPAPVSAPERMIDGGRTLPVDGPAIVTEPGATLCVDDGWNAEDHPSGALHLRRSRSPAPATGMPHEVVAARCAAIAGWMSAVLERTARSVNVRDRLDYSCGVLSAEGLLVANAPNVPVHLGALGACVRSILEVRPIAEGEVVLTNHPRFGGSHLPDLTVVRALHGADGGRIAYVAARAHHAEIGGIRAGSMPPDARSLAEEGVVIPPTTIARDGVFDDSAVREALAASPFPSRDPDLNVDDLRAAIAALEAGAESLRSLACAIGDAPFRSALELLLARSAARTAGVARRVPAGGLARTERLDDGTPIAVRIDRDGDRLRIDFAGSGGTHPGPFNAPLAVTRSAVLYALRVLAGLDEELDEHRAPLNEGFLVPVDLRVPEGLLNPAFAADGARCPPVFAGNTETSQRVVDAVLGAFGVSAASQGTMNNLVVAGDGFGLFETIGGGSGASPERDGASAVHVHMTNTRNTDPEVLERRTPLRLERFEVRAGSGGGGRRRGGDGLVRTFRTAAPCEACFVAQRRGSGPAGAAGGADGAPGAQRVIRADGGVEQLGGTFTVRLEAGDALEIETPGGGGFGDPVSDR